MLSPDNVDKLAQALNVRGSNIKKILHDFLSEQFPEFQTSSDVPAQTLGMQNDNGCFDLILRATAGSEAGHVGEVAVGIIVCEMLDKAALEAAYNQLAELKSEANTLQLHTLVLARSSSDIEVLHQQGYGVKDIAAKTGLSPEYAQGVLNLIDRGEDRLLSAVESGKLPMFLAIKIVGSPGNEQRALQEAYESKQLKGKKFMLVKRIIDTRRRHGKTFGDDRNRKRSSGDLSLLTSGLVALRKAHEEPVNKIELQAIYGMISYVAHDQKVGEDIVGEIMTAHFGVDSVAALPSRLYQNAIEYLVDLQINNIMN